MTASRPLTPQLLQALLDESAEPLLALDARGTIRAVNAAAVSLFGGRRLPGKPLASLVELADRRALRTALGSLTPTEPERTLELAITNDGRRRHRLELRLLDSAPGHVAAVVRSKGRRPSHRTREQRDRGLDAALARIPLGIVRLHADGTIAFANAAAARALAAVGPPLEALHMPPLGAHVERLLSHHGPLIPTVVELPNGRSLRLSGSGPRGDELAVLVLDDVTRLVRQAEAHRTFVRNAAHQLRTPVAGISSALEALLAGAKDDPSERDRFLAHVARETERLARLTRALLVLARAQSGTQRPRLEFVPVAPMLQRLAEELEQRNLVAIDTGAPPGLAAFVEPDLIDEALRALADNALRHARRGRVALRAWRSGEAHLEIEVADDGAGILPEHLDRIFEPFFRPFEEGDGGFGLGLSIAHQAVTAMGGELRVASAPGEGTRMTIRLPSADLVAT